MNVLNAEEYGGFSVTWMISQAAKHVPRENLDFAFGQAIQYIDRLILEKPTLAPSDMLDALAQLILTGDYMPTAFPEHPYEDDPEDADTETPITEVDAEDLKKFLDRFPDAEDPMTGFVL